MYYNSDIFKLRNYSIHLEYYKTYKTPISDKWISIRNHAIIEYASLVISLYEKIKKNGEYEKMNDDDKILCYRMYAFSTSLDFKRIRQM